MYKDRYVRYVPFEYVHIMLLVGLFSCRLDRLDCMTLTCLAYIYMCDLFIHHHMFQSISMRTCIINHNLHTEYSCAYVNIYIYIFFCSRDIHVSTIHRRSLYMHLIIIGIVFNYGHVEQGNTPIEVAMFATIGYILPEYWRCDVSESG